jgi:hypothetical protein
MADRILQVVLYDEEDRKLDALAKATERDRSKMVRFMINREYAVLFPTVSPETPAVDLPAVRFPTSEVAAMKATELGE